MIWETILSISDESKFQKFGKLEKFWILLTKLAVQLDHIISTVGIDISPTIILRLTGFSTISTKNKFDKIVENILSIVTPLLTSWYCRY